MMMFEFAKLPDFPSEKDDSLVLYMALKDEDLEIAEGACAEFYKRHYSFLVAFGRGRRWETTNQPIETFVDQVFQKAWHKAARFRCPASLSIEKSRRKVRAWLLKILKNLFLNIYAEQDGNIISLDELLLDSEDEGKPIPQELTISDQHEQKLPVVSSPIRTLVLKFIDQTDERTRAILYAADGPRLVFGPGL
jgi:DNA-directed RNA polymerase specialized sigma24 family protein